jgi:hypothetical protein
MDAQQIAILWEQIAAHLEAQRLKTIRAIQNYPPPITACDQQFDYLLAERDQISAELRRAGELAASPVEYPSGIIEFLRTSPRLDDSLRQQLLAAVAKASAE